MSQEDKLVPLKEPTCCVHVHRVGDLVCQIDHALLHLISRDGVLDGFLEHHVEGLGSGQRERGGSEATAAGSFWLILTGALGEGGEEDPQVGFPSTLWFLPSHMFQDLGYL